MTMAKSQHSALELLPRASTVETAGIGVGDPQITDRGWGTGLASEVGLVCPLVGAGLGSGGGKDVPSLDPRTNIYNAVIFTWPF
jgi:hypothetical protein